MKRSLRQGMGLTGWVLVSFLAFGVYATLGIACWTSDSHAEELAAESAPSSKEEVFHYRGAERRDPFKSLLVLQEKKKDTSALPPIQRIDVQMFNVVGVIMDDAMGNRAMVKAPGGKTYVIKNGDLIGKNEGEVVSINLVGITVREKFLDFMNKETIVTTVLKVSKKQ